jgi:hypothetical protein
LTAGDADPVLCGVLQEGDDVRRGPSQLAPSDAVGTHQLIDRTVDLRGGGHGRRIPVAGDIQARLDPFGPAGGSRRAGLTHTDHKGVGRG